MPTGPSVSYSVLAFTLLAGSIATQTGQTPLPGAAIPKYVDALPHFSGVRIDAAQSLAISMTEFQQEVLPAALYRSLPAPFHRGTFVWGYGVADDRGHQLAPPLYPGFTLEARRGVPTRIRYINRLVQPLLQSYLLVDQTLHWANPIGPVGNPLRDPYVGPVPACVHLHGGEVPSSFDGGPDQWFTPDGIVGRGYASLSGAGPGEAIYRYPNAQEAATLWFHDHTLGATRLNVFAGLAAFYLLRDDRDSGVGNRLGLPADPYEIEVAIQDRMFDTNGQWYFPHMGDNPEHPFWIPEFLGDAIVVNGKTWPYLEVEPRRYRFRFLNGSNARFYSLWLEDEANAPGPSFWQIGSDGGLLDRPVEIAAGRGNPPARLLMAPGERVDLILDFARHAGRTFTLRNDANAPFPFGDPVDPDTNGQIMQFRVVLPLRGRDCSLDPARNPRLREPMVCLIEDALRGGLDARRLLTLNEVMGENGPLEALVNNSKWGGRRPDGTPIPGAVRDRQGNYVTELPRVGATELWQIVNLTGDAHPMHLHLVQFQLVARRAFDPSYAIAYEMSFPGGVFLPAWGPPLDYFSGNRLALGGNPEILRYLRGWPRPATPGEQGWKDTVITYPGEVTTLLVRYAPQDVRAGATRPGDNAYPFDPTMGPGYVWHCHIVDHEDNEMMRPQVVRR